MSSLPWLNFGIEPFAAEFFDKRGRQKWGDDDEPLIWFEALNPPGDFRKRLNALFQKWANIQPLEFREWWHTTDG